MRGVSFIFNVKLIIFEFFRNHWAAITLWTGIVGIAFISVFFTVKTVRDRIIQWCGFIVVMFLVLIGYSEKRGEE